MLKSPAMPWWSSLGSVDREKARWRLILFMPKDSAGTWRRSPRMHVNSLGRWSALKWIRLKDCRLSFIEQKTTSRNPRSTVGTVTELSDFLRLLYARASTAFSYKTGEQMVSYSDSQIIELIGERFMGKRIAVLAPVVRARKGTLPRAVRADCSNGICPRPRRRCDRRGK